MQPDRQVGGTPGDLVGAGLVDGVVVGSEEGTADEVGLEYAAGVGYIVGVEFDVGDGASIHDVSSLFSK